MKNALLLLLLFIICKPVVAQQSGPEITLHYGVVFAGSGHSIRQGLIDAGFDGRDNRGGIGALVSNHELRYEGDVQLGITLPVKSTYKVKGLLNYRDTVVKGASSNFGVLTMETSCLSVAAIGYIPQLPPAFRLGAGPAYHRAKAKPILNEETLAERNFYKPGFIIEGGFSTPAYKRFFADLQVQYYYVGKADAGTYTLQSTDFTGQPVATTISFSNTKYSSLFFSLGVGFRFQEV